jgi:putative flippase GtrA
MKKGDIIKVAVIGALVGLLIQPILSNVIPGVTLVMRLAIFIGLLVLAPVALGVAYLVDKVLHGIYQFAQFAAVGSLNTFVDIGVFNLAFFISGSVVLGSVAFATFKAISFLCATTNSFFWNKYWTFHSEGEAKAGQVASFFAVAIGGLLLNTAAGTLLNAARPLGLHDTMLRLWTSVIAPGGGVVASFLWNFLWYKYVVFKKSASVVKTV